MMRNDVWVAICVGTAIALMAVVALGTLSERSYSLAGSGPEPTAPVRVSLASPTVVPTLSGRMPIDAGEVRVSTTKWKDKTLTVVFAVRPGLGDYLFEPPLLRTQPLPLTTTARSLKAARTALLALAAGGEAEVSLVFDETAASGAGTVVFNASSTSDSLVAPRLEISVTWPMTPALTPLSGAQAAATPRKP